MSPQKQHVIHGRDHTTNGADPIPGLGAGGGALEWEDTGTTTPGLAIHQPRFVVFIASHDIPANTDVWLDFRAGPSLNNARSNDIPAEGSDYDSKEGGYFEPSSTTWIGDNFVGGTTDGFFVAANHPFCIPQNNGIYWLEVGINMYVGTPEEYDLDVTFEIPKSHLNTYGTIAGASWATNAIIQRFRMGGDQGRRIAHIGTYCLMRAPGNPSFPQPQPVGVMLHHNGGETATLGPPQAKLFAMRVSQWR